MIEPPAIRSYNREDDLPKGALGKLRIQTNIEGNQELGNQNTGFDLYHQTKNCCDPVVIIHRKEQD